MKALLILIVLIPVVLCFGLAYNFAAEENAFARGAESVRGTVTAINDRKIQYGSEFETITTVKVAFTTKNEEARTAEARVGYAVGLSAGKGVEVLYKKADPTKIQIRAGFFNRSGKLVFSTLFGVFWLVLGAALLGFLSHARALAKDPAAKEGIERMKEEFRRTQAEREGRGR